jgi:hypothetical protein
VDTETVTVSGNGTYSTPTGYLPAVVGTYQWVATYSGDSNNNTVTSPMGSEPVVVLTTCTSAIGDFVWNDLNHNGIQDAGEPGIPNVTVQLLDSGNHVIATTITDANGFYHFNGLCGGNYVVQIPSQSALIGYTSTLTLQGGNTQLDSNGTPASGTPPQTASVILANNTVDNSIDFGYVPATPCPAGSFTFSIASNGDLNIIYDQFPAPNDNSYGVNAVGWPSGHKFSDLVGSDHAGFQLVDQNGVVKLSFNIDYISQITTGTVPPSGYASLGPFGGDGKILVGTLTPADISYDSSLARNLNNVNIPGLFNASHVQQFGSVNVLVDSPPTDALHQTYNNSDPALAGWDFHDTYFVTIKAAKLASLGFDPTTWQVLPNLDQLHNSPAKPCPPTGPTLKVTTKQIGAKEVKVTIQNTGTTDEVINQIQLNWPNINGNLAQVKLGGAIIYDTPDVLPTSVTLTSFAGTAAQRTIKHGTNAVLDFVFQNNAGTVLTDYSGSITTTTTTLTILP